MALNLFGPPTKDDIKVAYIDPILGLVEGVSICEANEYAKKEPGTTFIFRNGNQTLQYLNVNEVNQLDPNVLTTTDECGGISQKKECGPPTIQIFGGGGIGAAGNPIVGNDGAILAVDIVRGGNGYQYPPLVSARDICNYGSGATFTTVIGEVVETTETFDNEADFEDYELCEPTDVRYGQNWGPDGEDLGPWDPKVYTEPGEDPIRKEIEDYQALVRRLARTPFWTTRKNKPTKITSNDVRIIPSKYDVTHPAWNKFFNSYAVSPVSPSNVKGTDFGATTFTMEWTEEFPTTGEYIFRGTADGKISELYIDDENIGPLSFGVISSYSGVNEQPPALFQRTITQGIHRIRVDILNGSFEEIVPGQSITEERIGGSLFVKEGDSYYILIGGNDIIEIDFVFEWEDNESFGYAVTEITIPTESGVPVILSRPLSGTVGSSKATGSFRADKKYGPIIFGGRAPGSRNPEIGDAGPGLGQRQQRIFFWDTEPGDLYSNAQVTAVNARQLSPGRVTTSAPVKVISPRSWNENPLGFALTIDAPAAPPPPQEQPPQQEGRCPNNPIWTTRFPGAKEFWYPVRYTEGSLWSKFLNKYAISPVRPLDTPGSDGGGSLFANSWDIDIPYDGFYKFVVEQDDYGKIYLDGQIIRLSKVFITRGRHTIGVELENRKTEAFDQVSQKIFRTLDWQVGSTIEEKPVGSIFVKEGDSYYILIGGNDIVEVDFVFNWFDSADFGYAVTKITIPTETNGPVVLSRPLSGTVGSSKATGTFRADKKYGPIIFEGVASRGQIIDSGPAPEQRQQIIEFFDNEPNDPFSNANLHAVNSRQLSPARLTGGLTGGISRDGVTYEGPSIFHYQDNRWSSYMNKNSISPVIPGDPADASGRKQFIWRGVNFPENGQYDIQFLADTNAGLIIGGTRVLSSQGFAENPQVFKVNITQGVYDVTVDSEYPYNSPETNNTQYFRDINPTGFALEIRKNISVLREGSGKSWKENPMGIGAILIPPPCTRRIRGKGFVTDVIVNDPGNGYLPPIAPTTTPPSTLALIQTNVPGAPGGGAGAGAGGGTGVPGGGTGVPGGGTVPLSIPSPPSGAPTGINASFRPQFEVVRDPVVIDPQKLLQVTDLVGLKQTGYVNGRAYYGAVYYDRGIRYAGFYETIGEPIQVYDTLRESIIAQVITPPSAILRQGTDIRSNNPLLNIPGTVQSTLSSNSIVGAGDISAPSVPFVQEPVQDPIYPVSLRLKRVLVEDPGINYNVTDQIRIIPSNGAVLEPVFGSFGRVIKVAVIDPGFGFTEYPRIEMFTPL